MCPIHDYRGSGLASLALRHLYRANRGIQKIDTLVGKGERLREREVEDGQFTGQAKLTGLNVVPN
jgi:hypothetical protein